MTTIVLIGCGKTKAAQPCEAWQMYKGQLFTKSLAYARMLTDDANIFVLSAKHHLLPLRARIEPYNETLNDLNNVQRRWWASQVRQHLFNLYPPTMTPPLAVVFLCGRNYHEHIADHLPDEWAWSTPLSDAGGIGMQLHYLTEQLNASRSRLSV